MLKNALGNIALDATIVAGNAIIQAIKDAIDLLSPNAGGGRKVLVGTAEAYISSNFAGASMPQDGFSVAATGSGHTVTLGGAANGARYLNIASGTTSTTETVIVSDAVLTLPARLTFQISASQRIANQELIVELAGCDSNGTISEDASGPLDFVQWKFDSTTAANSLVSSRSGGGSIYLGTSTAFGTTAATGTTPNFIPATTYDLIFTPDRVAAAGFAINAISGAGAHFGITTALPDPNKYYKLRIRVRNLTSPASTTDWRIHQIRLMPYSRHAVEVVGGVGRQSDQQVAVPVCGTVIISGTTTVDTELATAAALADGAANSTTAIAGAAGLNYNGATWDRVRNNAIVTTDSSAARTTSAGGTTQTNYNASGVFFVANVTAFSGTTPTLQYKIQFSPDGTNWIDLDATNAQTASITGTGLYTIKVYPSLTAAANGVANSPLPRTWRVFRTVGGTTPSFTTTEYALYLL